MQTSRAHSPVMLFVVFCAFISIGFPDAVLGVAWPVMRQTFDQDRAALGIILAFNSLGYFASGSLAGSIIDRIGVGKTLAFSTILVAVGLFGYSVAPQFWLLPFVAVCVGFGSGAVDAGLNFYAAENYSNRIMNLLHAFFGIGAMIGPFIMSGALDRGASWRVGYAIVATVTLALGIVFVTRMNSWGTETHHTEEAPARLSPRDVLRQRRVWLQIALFFFMVSIESGTGAWISTILHERFGESLSTAGIWTGAFWGAVAFGRLAIPMVFANVPTARIVQAGSWVMLAATLMMIIDASWATKLGVIVFGLGSAPMFPNLMTLTPHRFGRDVALHTIGYQVSAATLAIAVVPSIAGLASQRYGLVVIPIIFSAVAVLVVILETLLRVNSSHSDVVL